jgi:hypothetical protein
MTSSAVKQQLPTIAGIQFSKIEPRVEKTHSDHQKQQELLHDDQAVQKNPQDQRKALFLKEEGGNGDALKK